MHINRECLKYNKKKHRNFDFIDKLSGQYVRESSQTAPIKEKQNLLRWYQELQNKRKEAKKINNNDIIKIN